MDCKRIGLLIQSLRKEHGWTQQELAEKIGVSDKAVSKWERGLGCPDISLIRDLAEVLEVSVSEILAGKIIKGQIPEKEMGVITTEAIELFSGEAKKSLMIKAGIIISALAIALVALVVVNLVSDAKEVTKDELYYEFEEAANTYFGDVENFMKNGRVDIYYEMVGAEVTLENAINHLMVTAEKGTKDYKRFHFLKYRLNQFAEEVKLSVNAENGKMEFSKRKAKGAQGRFDILTDYYKAEFKGA